MSSWQTDHPPTTESLNLCVQCGLCLPVCPTFRLSGREDQSPRGRLTAMSALDEGLGPLDDTVANMLDTCLGCRACEAICPSLVPYGEIIELAQSEVAVTRPGLKTSTTHLVLSRGLASKLFLTIMTWGADLLQRLRAGWLMPARLRGSFAGVRRLAGRGKAVKGGVWEPEGTPIGTVGLLSGCVMDEWFRPVHHATVDVLTAAGWRVVAPAAQTCCGALTAHAGDREGAQRLAAVNLAAFADVDVVVSNSAGCGAHLESYGHLVEGGDALAVKAMDVTELVAEAIADGRLPVLEAGAGPVAVQDPCHLRHAQRVIEAPRAVIRASGHEPVEIDPAALCCGAAGTFSLFQPEISGELGRRKADQVRASGAPTVCSANPGCDMQLRGHLAGDADVRHPVEIYAEALRAARATR